MLLVKHIGCKLTFKEICLKDFFYLSQYCLSNLSVDMYCQHMRDDDVYDEDEVRHLLQTGSESEHENVSTEMGYDADSEETNFDESEKGLQ